jgi:hypothetical protein
MSRAKFVVVKVAEFGHRGKRMNITRAVDVPPFAVHPVDGSVSVFHRTFREPTRRTKYARSCLEQNMIRILMVMACFHIPHPGRSRSR